MGRTPRQFGVETSEGMRLWREERNTFLASPHIPTLAALSVVHALLQHIKLPGLNREVAEADIRTALLLTNADVHDITTYASGNEEALGWVNNIHARLGPILVKRVLDDCCRHSATRMRKESNEVLLFLNDAPFDACRSKRIGWININLPKILLSLKNKQRCFTECPGRTAWPPKQLAERDVIDMPPAINNPVAMKNAILAYFHGLQPHTIRHYLAGRKLKSGSRSRKPRS